jgi:signal transduction histidine kinase
MKCVDLHAEHRAELEALARRRLPLSMGMLLLVILAALPIEVYFDPKRLVPYIAVYTVEVLASLAALIAAHCFTQRARTIATAWGSTLGICMASYYPLVNGDATLAMTALICLVATLPAMLPYGVWHQAFLGGACTLGFLVALLFGIPLSLHWPYVFVAFVTVLVTSTIAARELSRFRWAAFEREASLRHAHDQLRTALARAESAVEMRSRLVANVSHELRTPINVIIGYTDMLLDAIEQPKVINDTAPRIREYAVTLEALVSDLLDLSRLTCGKVEVSVDDVELIPLLEDVARGVQRLVGDKPVTVLVECDPVRVRCDRMRLSQILNNLATNAAKFTAEGSIAIRARADREGVRFEVSDTGCGIPAEQHALIFRAFEQLGTADRSARGGIGLGLAIVRQLTDLLGGTITVVSAPGKGSTFAVTFPTMHATAISPAAAPRLARTAA